jgi:hypothetical protein
MKRDPIAGAVLLGVIVALLLAPWAGAGVQRLRHLREEQDGLADTLAAQPAAAPLVAPGLALAARSPAAARAALAVRVRQLAKNDGILVEQIAPAEVPAPLVSVQLGVSGQEKAVLSFADTIERDAPLARFSEWTLAPEPGGTLRLTGRLTVATR